MRAIAVMEDNGLYKVYPHAMSFLISKDELIKHTSSIEELRGWDPWKFAVQVKGYGWLFIDGDPYAD